MAADTPDVWLRGPVSEVPPLLQPVAHALLQAAEEAEALLNGFPDDLLWTRPAGVASAGFHLQHMGGVVDRLFTYARGEPLSPQQRRNLAAEGEPTESARRDSALTQSARTGRALVSAFQAQVEVALAQLRGTDERTLTDARGVGRAQLPSTVLGLLVHAAEHTQRHLGQLIVTVRVQTPPSGARRGHGR
jgi:hypothetical protein